MRPAGRAKMWSTIANFKDNLTQIASDVLDTADELKRAGSQGEYDDELFDDSHGTSHRSSYSDKGSDLKAELEWYRNEVPRLQAAESAIQSTCTNYASLLKDKEDELLRIREENGLLKGKLAGAPLENGSQPHDDEGEVKQLQEALKKLQSEHAHSEDLHQKQLAELQGRHQKQFDLLIAKYEGRLVETNDVIDGDQDSPERYAPSKSNGPIHRPVQDGQAEKLEARLLQLQESKEDLASQVLEKDEALGKLRSAYDNSLSEVRRLTEERSKDKEASLRKDSQLQRDQEAAEASVRDNEILRRENLKIAEQLRELQRSIDEQDATSGSAMEALQLTISNLEKDKAELEGERNRLVRSLEVNAQGSSDDPPKESAALISEAEVLNLREAAAEVDRLLERVKEAEEACASQKMNFEKQLDKVASDRDKALRDLGRLRQHLLDKERADSEKMDQDTEQIAELQARAENGVGRAVQAEQALSVALADLREARRQSQEAWNNTSEEIGILQQRLTGCIAALESKDVELSNLQSALGQYYAESEAQDRVYLELSTAKEENSMLSQQLQAAHQTIEVKNGERDTALEKLALFEKKTLESQQKTKKLEEEVLRLRRALEQSMTRLNTLSSDSDHHVDRRIVIKLLVTYFQRNHSKEVLDLMVRILGFSEEDKRRVGLAQQAASRGVVRGVLGLPGRFVGGIIGSASPDSLSIPSPSENKSFADLWIDFLLKESEERERREKAEAIERAEKAMGSDEYRSGTPNSRVQTPSSLSAIGSMSTPASPPPPIRHRPSSSFSNFPSSPPEFAGAAAATSYDEAAAPPLQSLGSAAANGRVLARQGSAGVENDFSSIPLTSTLSGNLSHLSLPPRF